MERLTTWRPAPMPQPDSPQVSVGQASGSVAVGRVFHSVLLSVMDVAVGAESALRSWPPPVHRRLCRRPQLVNRQPLLISPQVRLVTLPSRDDKCCRPEMPIPTCCSRCALKPLPLLMSLLHRPRPKAGGGSVLCHGSLCDRHSGCLALDFEHRQTSTPSYGASSALVPPPFCGIFGSAWPLPQDKSLDDATPQLRGDRSTDIGAACVFFLVFILFRTKKIWDCCVALDEVSGCFYCACVLVVLNVRVCVCFLCREFALRVLHALCAYHAKFSDVRFYGHCLLPHCRLKVAPRINSYHAEGTRK